MARPETEGRAVISFKEESVLERLSDLTLGNGPERSIDAVGMESHATRFFAPMYDRAKQAVMLETDRPHVLREMIMCAVPRARCRHRAYMAG